uniref:Uncharacterized protein n=1 Tax=Arundo donax TaxID=35708 RepID=A0A0A9AUW0_ARUDO
MVLLHGMEVAVPFLYKTGTATSRKNTNKRYSIRFHPLSQHLLKQIYSFICLAKLSIPRDKGCP